MKRRRGTSIIAGMLSICLCIPALPGSVRLVEAAETGQDTQYVRIRCHDTANPFYMAVNEQDPTWVEAAVDKDYGLDNTVWIEEDTGQEIDGSRVVKLKNYATQTYMGVEDGELLMMEDSSLDDVKWEVDIKMDDEWEWTGNPSFAWNRYKPVTAEGTPYLCTQGVSAEGGPLLLVEPDSDDWWSNEWRYETVSEDELLTKPGEAATEEELAALTEMIGEARAALEDPESYRTKSLNALESSIEAAEKISSKDGVSGETVNAQTEALALAVSQLEQVEDGKLYAPGEMAIAGQDTIGSQGAYYLDFQEEFDGDTLDTDKWLDEYLPHWTPNEEDSKARYELRDGELVLQVREEDQPWSPQNDGKVICSGITTFNKNYIHNFTGSNTLYEHPDSTSTDNNYFDGYTMKYGYVEMRAKMEDDGGGGHQALWMVGTQSDADNWSDSRQTAEIDVLETSFYDAYKNWRLCGYGWNDRNFCPSWYTSDTDVPSGDPGKEYHTYGMEWTPTQLNFYYDGELYRTIDSSPDYEMGIILSIYQNAGWSGGKPSADNWPKEFCVDYIRVYKPADGYGQETVDKTALTELVKQAEEEAARTDIYTEESISNLKQAAADAGEVLKNDAATSEAVADCEAALKAALEQLVKLPVESIDKNGLKAMVSMLEKLSGDDYSGATWDALQEKLAAAKIVLEDENAGQSHVDEAYEDVVNAFRGLEAGLNKAAAQTMVDQGEMILKDPGKYRPQGIETLRDNLNLVKAALLEETTTQSELNRLTLKLLDALIQLQDMVDASSLQSTADLAEELLAVSGKYTSDSVKKLEEALLTAKEVLGNENRTQQQVSSAYTVLTEAIAGLQMTGSKEALEPLIEKAAEILGQAEKYSAASLKGLQEVLDAAQAVYGDKDALQSEINQAAVDLAEKLASVRILGDVNHDSRVDTKDAAALLKANAELDDLSVDSLHAADVNKDGSADTADAVLIEKYAAEMISNF